jgi:hypothetical protein
MTVTCFIKGGLGNQLFQIYATVAYAFSNKQSVVFPYQSHMYGGCTPRDAYWDTFLLPMRRHTTYGDDADQKNATMSHWPVIKCMQHHFMSIKSIPEHIPNIRIDGYFQSYKYFSCSDGERWLNRVLKIREQVAQMEELYDMRTVYSISMHFRLGDYKQLQHCHTVLDDNYYIHALETVLLRIINPSNKPVRVYYLCEAENRAEVEERIAHIQTLFEGRATFMRVPEGVKQDWEQMLFMSACESNIIANSTFSWWSAYWNPSPWKVVCYPRQWFGPALSEVHDVKDMFPDDWVLV